MNRELTALLTLLRAGLWEREPDDLSLFPLSDEGWEGVFRMARCQTVIGLVWQGIRFLPECLLPSESLLACWIAQTDAVERKNRRMNGAIAGLYAWFREEKLNPVLQKGQGVALLYERPLLRQCGDIDLYFPTEEERWRAISLIRRQGIAVQGKADGSIHYRWNGIDVEHHSRLIGLSSPSVRKRLERLESGEGYRRIPFSTEMDAEITVPAPLLNLLLLNAHILRHAMGRGIGLRQLCDMARACYRLHDEVDGEALRALYYRVGIGRWSRLLHSFLTAYMGLSPAFLPYREEGLSPLPLLDIVVKGGNFGLHFQGEARIRVAAWRRKMETSYSFLRNARFSCTYVPQEAFWTFVGLLAGQFK